MGKSHTNVSVVKWLQVMQSIKPGLKCGIQYRGEVQNSLFDNPTLLYTASAPPSFFLIVTDIFVSAIMLLDDTVTVMAELR